MGSRTGWREMTPGASRSTGQRLRGVDGPLVINGLAERVDYAADHAFANGHAENLASALDFVAFADLGVIAEKHSAHLVLFKAHGETGNAVRKLQQFASHDFVEAVDAGDAVTEGDHSADFIDLDTGIVVCNLLPEELRDFVCLNLRHASLSQHNLDF